MLLLLTGGFRLTAPGSRHKGRNSGGKRGVYLECDEIKAYIGQNFGMYRRHYHAAGNPGKSLGWLRNMWNSPVQQVVRRGPVYYALVAAASLTRAGGLYLTHILPKIREEERILAFCT